MAECCGKDVFDKDKQLCCGPADNKTILVRNSRHHECCGHSQYDTETQCCCSNEEKMEIQPNNSSCCVKNLSPGVEKQITELQPNCTEPNTHLCGSSCYNPKESQCCERNQKPHWFCASGLSKTTPTVYNPRTQVCCDGCVSAWKPWIDQVMD
ncbi:galaxin-like [Neolamprologus brichardi]|uniref:galaxin-like n=1 Tax=Neolamprologus brichardi TaxID=32507 RepID=UPI001643FA83|nr:galaxin-like [Neolamprologus brichardi]